MVNVPEGVPWDPPPPPPPPPPPQDASRIITKLAPARAIILRERKFPTSSNAAKPNRATTTGLSGIRFVPCGGRATIERAIVVTVTWKLVGVEPRLSRARNVASCGGWSACATEIDIAAEAWTPDHHVVGGHLTRRDGGAGRASRSDSETKGRDSSGQGRAVWATGCTVHKLEGRGFGTRTAGLISDIDIAGRTCREG